MLFLRQCHYGQGYTYSSRLAVFSGTRQVCINQFLVAI